MVSTTKCSSSTFSFSSGGASTCIGSTAPCNSGMFSYPDPSLADLDLDFYYFCGAHEQEWPGRFDIETSKRTDIDLDIGKLRYFGNSRLVPFYPQQLAQSQLYPTCVGYCYILKLIWQVLVKEMPSCDKVTVTLGSRSRFWGFGQCCSVPVVMYYL